MVNLMFEVLFLLGVSGSYLELLGVSGQYYYRRTFVR